MTNAPVKMVRWKINRVLGEVTDESRDLEIASPMSSKLITGQSSQPGRSSAGQMTDNGALPWDDGVQFFRRIQVICAPGNYLFGHKSEVHRSQALFLTNC